jgi:hypothetical protein
LGARVIQVLEDPWVSKSIRVTVWPWRRKKAAKLADTVLLPTPPFWLVTKILNVDIFLSFQRLRWRRTVVVLKLTKLLTGNGI